jgi:hypothetical protein
MADTTTSLTDSSYSGSNIRSAASLDGTQFWTGGTASSGANGGVRYLPTLGPTTATQVSSSVTNIRVVNVFGGQLYASSGSGAFVGVSTVGTGTPTGSGETMTLLVGTGTGSSPYDFFFADPSTVYIADDPRLPPIIESCLQNGNIVALMLCHCGTKSLTRRNRAPDLGFGSIRQEQQQLVNRIKGAVSESTGFLRNTNFGRVWQ